MAAGNPPAMPQTRSALPLGGALLAMGALIAVGVVVPWLDGGGHPGKVRVGVWLASMALLFLFCVITGMAIRHRRTGLLIDERNKISLARLQFLLWMIVILAAIWAGSMCNLVYGQSDPLSVHIPQELLEILGISAVSLAAAPLILSQKPQPLGMDATGQPLAPAHATAEDRRTAANTVHVHAENQTPDWTDLVRGDVEGNQSYLDLGKVQVLFLTLLVVIAYCGMLWARLGASDLSFQNFPALQQGIVALLAVSHAGYLTTKAVPPQNS